MSSNSAVQHSRGNIRKRKLQSKCSVHQVGPCWSWLISPLPNSLSGDNVRISITDFHGNNMLTLSLGGGSGYMGSTVCTASATCSTQNPCTYLGSSLSPPFTPPQRNTDFLKDYAQCIPATAGGAGSTTSTTSTSKTTLATTTATVTTKTSTGVTTTAPTTTGPTVTNSGNPFSGYQLYANPYYSSEVISLAVPSLSSSLAAKASAVAKVPSFVWL